MLLKSEFPESVFKPSKLIATVLPIFTPSLYAVIVPLATATPASLSQILIN
jgi:hypothetical protein